MEGQKRCEAGHLMIAVQTGLFIHWEAAGLLWINSYSVWKLFWQGLFQAVLAVQGSCKHSSIAYTEFQEEGTWPNQRNTNEPRKKPSYFPLYSLFNRDRYSGLLESPHSWAPTYPKQAGFFRCSNGGTAGWGIRLFESLCACNRMKLSRWMSSPKRKFRSARDIRICTGVMVA